MKVFGDKDKPFAFFMSLTFTGTSILIISLDQLVILIVAFQVQIMKLTI